MDELRGLDQFRVHVKEQDVRLDLVVREAQPFGTAHVIRQNLRVGVIFSESIDMMFQRMKRAGGDDPALPHPSAEDFSVATRQANQWLRSCKSGTHGSTEAFAEAILAGIEGDSFAHAALTAALRELVATYGEDCVAAFAETLPAKLRAGEFTTGLRH